MPARRCPLTLPALRTWLGSKSSNQPRRCCVSTRQWRGSPVPRTQSREQDDPTAPQLGGTYPEDTAVDWQPARIASATTATRTLVDCFQNMSASSVVLAAKPQSNTNAHGQRSLPREEWRGRNCEVLKPPRVIRGLLQVTAVACRGKRSVGIPRQRRSICAKLFRVIVAFVFFIACIVLAWSSATYPRLSPY